MTAILESTDQLIEEVVTKKKYDRIQKESMKKNFKNVISGKRSIKNRLTNLKKGTSRLKNIITGRGFINAHYKNEKLSKKLFNGTSNFDNRPSSYDNRNMPSSMRDLNLKSSNADHEKASKDYDKHNNKRTNFMSKKLDQIDY